MIGAGRTLLVLGGTGFFGKSILDAYRRGLLVPWDVSRVIVAARRPGVLVTEHPELLTPGVDCVALDIGTTATLPQADIIIHAANTTDARRYADDPVRERRAILAAAENFVMAAADGHRDARIVYASSGAVYGAQPATLEGLSEDDRPADANSLVAYKRDYAEAKLLAEQAIGTLGSRYGMNVAVARCFAFVGPYLPRDQHFAVGNFLADGLAGGPVVVAARHPVIRSYLYADDLVEWLMTVADRAAPDCPVYNVGSDEAVEIGDLAQRVAARFGVGVDRAVQTSTAVDRYVPSIARARRSLGLRVRYDLDAALAATARRLGASLSARSSGELVGVGGS